MKLVFDDGTEQEIRQEDFYKILIRAEAMATRQSRRFHDIAEVKGDINEWESELHYMKKASDEDIIARVCTTLETLYF